MTSTRWMFRAGVAGLMTMGFAGWPAIATADPLSEALATTTCNYAQVTAAMKAQAPQLAAQLSLRPDMQAYMQSFLAMSVEQRRAEIAQQQAVNPQIQQMMAALIGPQVSRVAASCAAY